MQHGTFWLMEIWQDVRYAARQLRRAPGYALFTILVLALGIGTVTAMFAIAYAVLLKPLPFQADRGLFQPLEKTTKGDDTLSLSYDEIGEWQQATRGSAEVAFSGGGLNIADGPTGALLIRNVEVSPNLFAMLGVRAMSGRAFSAEGEGTDPAKTVVLSDALWRESFSGDPAVLGRTIHIGGIPYTVVGVMPPHFMYPMYENWPEAWVPLDASETTASNKDPYLYYEPIVRVRPGTPLAAVETQLAQVHRNYAGQKVSQIRLARLRDLLVGDVRPALLALEIAVILVWLIACSNVAGLMLARVAVRRTEIAVRAALGAGRWRVASQFFAESLLLSLIGAIGGLALALAMLRGFRHMLTESLPLASGIHMNWAIWFGLVAITLITGLVFGAFPALVAGRIDPQSGLRNAGRIQTGERGENRARSVLLVCEVALSVTLLIAAGLMMRTMYALRHVPLGFRTDHLVVTSLTVPNDLYRDRNVTTAVWQPVLDEIRRIPGVRSAALSTVLPILHPVELITMVYRTEWMQEDAAATVRAASPGLIQTLGVPMRSGRFFTDEDTANSLPVAVVNQTFVNRYLGGADALGKQIRYGHIPRVATVVGVIGNIHQDSVTKPSEPEFYLCMSQLGPDNSTYRALLGRVMEVAVRTDSAPNVLIPELRKRIRQTNPHLAAGESMTMEEAVEDSIGAQKLAAHVVGVFGGLVLLITVVGLYGLLNYLVAHRTQEIGIRMALGADRSRVVAMVMRRMLALLVSGVIAGVGLAFATDRLLQNFLFGVSSMDPWSLGLAPVLLVICGVLAAMMPARRAATINPVEALRGD